MFSSLDKRMQIILQVVIVLYVIVSSAFVLRTIKSQSLDMQHTLALQYTGQQHQNAQLFMKWMEEMAGIVASDRNVQHAIAGGPYDKTITPLLDGLGASNLYILDLVLYGSEDSMYASSRVSGIRSYNEVRTIPEYRDFLESELSSQWLIMDHESLVYRQTDPRYRLLYLEKLTLPDSTGDGLLVMDVDLHKMIGFYAFPDPKSYPGSQAVLYTHDRTVVDTSGRLHELPEDLKFRLSNMPPQADVQTLELDNGTIYVYRMLRSGDYVLLNIPNAPVFSELAGLWSIVVAGTVAIVIISFILIRRLSASIFDPLRELYRNMRRHYNK